MSFVKSVGLPPPAPVITAGADRTGLYDVGRGPPILFIPGLNGSGPKHWQAHWERSLPTAERVEQADWDRPSFADWTAKLVERVRRRPGAVLVAHSLGCALVAHLTAITGGRDVAGALLVAPADVDRATPAGRLLTGFAPMPLERLGFPSLVVTSRNDPYVAIERARTFARGWGSAFADVGTAGHINVDSGHGPWVEGHPFLDAVCNPAAAVALGQPSPQCSVGEGHEVSLTIKSGYPPEQFFPICMTLGGSDPDPYLD